MACIVFLSVFARLTLSGDPHMLLGDTDTGIHIKAGQLILQTLSVPKYDPFSFHSPPLPWTAYEWLSEVIMALVHRAFGLTGIVVFFALVISSTYYLLFKILRKENRDILLSTFFVFLVIASSSLHWLARPHIFSLLLTLVYYYVLSTYQYRGSNHLWVLPLLMLVWVNLHGGFIVGIILIGVYLSGNLIRIPFLANSEQTTGKDKAPALGLALLGCVFVALINPYGYHILIRPFEVVSDTFLMDHITEFLSPNFHGTLPFRYLLYLTIAIFALSGSRTDMIEIALVLLFTHMALYSARYIPLFAIVVCPILVKHAERLLQNTDGKLANYLKRRSANMALVDASLTGYAWTIGALILLSLGLLNGKIQFRFDEKISPITAIQFLEKENLTGNMFNNETFGDSVIYLAWPQYRVFVDGRSDMYGSSLMKDYIDVVFLAPDWNNILDKYKINWVFENSNSALSVLLSQTRDWRLIYADRFAHIYLKNVSENQSILRRFSEVKPVSADKPGEPS
jgi:hypothetical protein